MLGVSIPQTHINDSFKSFIIDNNIATTMAAVTIGFSTGIMIRSLVGDIILPAIYALFVNKINVLSGAFAPISKLNLDNFIKELVTWVMVILFTFIIIGSVFKAWLKKPVPVPPAPTPTSSVPAPAPTPPPVKKDNSVAASIATEHFIRSHPW